MIEARARVCVVFCLVLTAGSVRAGTADRVVAVVGDQPILQSQVQAGVEFVKLAAESSAKDVDSALRSQVLEQLISDQVILEEARQETVTVEKSDVDDQLNESIKALNARFGSPDSLNAALAREGLTEATLRQRYRDEITKRLTAQRLLAKHGLLENIVVTPTEVQQFYASHRDSFGVIPGRVTLAHIMIIPRPSEDVERKAYEQMLEAYTGLMQNGWDFEAIAGSFSTDPQVKRRNGALGTVTKGELPLEVDSVLFSLKVGEFSPPFRSRFGWEIVKREKGSGDQATAREILIVVPTTKKDTTRAYDQALSLRKRALAGEDFETLAKQESNDIATRDQGGLLGEFFLKGLAEPFASAVKDVKAGEISMPVKSDHGFHIIKVLDRVDDKTPSFEELQDDIRTYLNNQKLQQKLDEFVKSVSARIYIQRY